MLNACDYKVYYVLLVHRTHSMHYIRASIRVYNVLEIIQLLNRTRNYTVNKKGHLLSLTHVPSLQRFLVARLARSDPRNSFFLSSLHFPFCPCIFLFVLAFSLLSLHFHCCPSIFIKISKHVQTF